MFSIKLHGILINPIRGGVKSNLFKAGGSDLTVRQFLPKHGLGFVCNIWIFLDNVTHSVEENLSAWEFFYFGPTQSIGTAIKTMNKKNFFPVLILYSLLINLMIQFKLNLWEEVFFFRLASVIMNKEKSLSSSNLYFLHTNMTTVVSKESYDTFLKGNVYFVVKTGVLAKLLNWNFFHRTFRVSTYVHCFGVIQQLRGQNFAIFWPPSPLRGQFLYPKCGQKQTFFDPFPPHLVHVVIE